MLNQSNWPVNRIKEKSTIEYRLESVTNLQATSQDIFQFWGIFGIGKTTLLLAFRDLFNKAGIDNTYIDLGKFTKTPHQIYIIEELANQLSTTKNITNRLSTLIQEHQKLETPVRSQPLLADIDRKNLLVAKIEDEFLYLLRRILDERPVIMLFDRVESLTPGSEALAEGFRVRIWLEQLYQRTQLDKRLTFILGGRDRIREWNSRNGKMRAEDPIELSLFNIDETKEHLRRITLDAPYNNLHDTIGTYIHDFTLGYPFGNVCLENKLRRFHGNLKDSSIDKVDVRSWDWDTALREASDDILDKWLQTSTDKEILKALVHSVAVLRDFDRDAATYMMEKIYPDLSRDLKQQKVQGFLTYLTRVTLLSKEASTLFSSFYRMPDSYRMQDSVRRLIMEDISRNKVEEYRKANEIAREYYKAQVVETARNEKALMLFKHAVVELLYYEAKLYKLTDAAPKHEIGSKLWDQVDIALGEFYGQNPADRYIELCDDLATILEQDEEFSMLIGKDELGTLLERLNIVKAEKPKHTHYDILISYNSREEKEVMYIAQLLKSFGLMPWLDKWDIPKLSRWLPELEHIISIIPAAIIVVGASGEGPWQSMEVDMLVPQYRQRNIFLGYALMPGCPDNFQGRETLNMFQRADLRQNLEEQIEHLAMVVKNRNRWL